MCVSGWWFGDGYLANEGLRECVLFHVVSGAVSGGGWTVSGVADCICCVAG